jgi:hypothetical protein
MGSSQQQEYEDPTMAAAAAVAAATATQVGSQQLMPDLTGQVAKKRQRLGGRQSWRNIFNECEEEEGDHEVIIGNSDDEAGLSRG